MVNQRTLDEPDAAHLAATSAPSAGALTLDTVQAAARPIAPVLAETTAGAPGHPPTVPTSPGAPDLAMTRSTAPVAATRPELALGTVLGRYLVLERLGAGAMGVVYSAFDPELDRKVAIKLLQPDPRGSQASMSRDARARLVREAQALARLSHPSVVAIHDVGVHGDEVWIAMELVRGRVLRTWLAERRRGWRGRSPSRARDLRRRSSRCRV